MQRKVGIRDQQRQQPGEVVEVPRDQDLARLAAQPIANPVGGIVWLQIARRRKLSERIACAPERFGRLFRTQLSAVPHDLGMRAALGSTGGEAGDGFLSMRRERPPRIHVGTDGFAVMNKKESQLLTKSEV